ncbi:hypothetical protein SAMN05519105_1545 [Rhodobacter sp. 24-YEA-8]|nr:hypothetical protein SAMN05519105_1545 [Rhodobacter sp. 24-YEA-8]
MPRSAPSPVCRCQLILTFSVVSNRNPGLGDTSRHRGSFTLNGAPRNMSVKDDEDVFTNETGVENDGALALATNGESRGSARKASKA